MHITDIKKYQKCHKLYEYSITNPDKSSKISFFNINVDINKSIASKLKIADYATGEIGQKNEDTLMLATQKEWIFKARVEYKSLRLRVPLIHFIDGNHCEIYSILLSTSVSNEEYTNLFYYQKALVSLGIEVISMYVLHLNKTYIRDNDLDNEQLWAMNTHKDSETTILDYVNTLEIDLDQMINEIENFTTVEKTERTKSCSGRNRCAYYETCFPEETNLPDNTILSLVSSAHKYEMFVEGIKYLKDANIDKIEGNRVQYSQIMADKNGGRYIDKKILQGWLNEAISYPISFIDFEWDLYPIPPYFGMKPLDVLMFQYSLHVYDGQELKHYQFIGEKDCRRELAESMISNLPTEGTIFAYNAKGAEKIRINELAKTFPDLSESLNSINSRMVDMADPFTSGIVYDTRFRGNFTLKVLEEVIDEEHSYHDLDCGNGMEAVVIHRKLENCKSEEEKQVYLNQLFQYCGLDTYSLYKVLNWLIDICKDN